MNVRLEHGLFKTKCAATHGDGATPCLRRFGKITIECAAVAALDVCLVRDIFGPPTEVQDGVPGSAPPRWQTLKGTVIYRYGGDSGTAAKTDARTVRFEIKPESQSNSEQWPSVREQRAVRNRDAIQEILIQ